MNGAAALRLRIAVAGHGDQAVDEIGRRLGHRQRIPAQLIRRRRQPRRTARSAVHAAAAANGPCAAAGRMRYSQERRLARARRGERGARELLGIQSVGAALRRILRAAARRAAPRSQTDCRSRSGTGTGLAGHGGTLMRVGLAAPHRATARRGASGRARAIRTAP